MTDATVGGAAKASSRYFYAWMALTCMAIAVLGFMPTYFMPLVQGTFRAEPIVHIHGLVLFSWCALLCTQTWLVAKGGTLAHRSWGMLGIAIVTAMAFIVTAVVSLRMSQAATPGMPAAQAFDLRAFAWVSISGLLFFVPVFVIAVVQVKKPDVHKRLMLLGTIALLGAPIARWFLTFLAPPPDPNAPVFLLANGGPAPVAPPIEVAIPPALVGDILWVIAMVYDWRTTGRVHPVYLIGGAIMLVMQLTVGVVGHSDTWQGIAAALGHLAG
jgi:hypothetical protein